MRSVLLAATIAAGCFNDEPPVVKPDVWGPTTTVADEESSSSGDSSSSEGVEESTGAQSPYGPCVADPSCHCDGSSCVAPCSTDIDCPGISKCLDGGCFLTCVTGNNCETEPYVDDAGLCHPAACSPYPGTGWHVCRWYGGTPCE